MDELIKFKNEAETYQDQLLDQLMAVLDPEQGIDIVNLGLIYELDMDTEGNLHVLMTLTTIGCPLADVIGAEIKYALSELDFVNSIETEVTFEPAWDISRLSRYGRIALGIRGYAINRPLSDSLGSTILLNLPKILRFHR